MSRDWQQMVFAEAVEINPRRPVRAGATVPYVEMAAVPSDGASIEYLRERQVGGGGSRFRNGDTLFARITPCAENGKTALVDCLRQDATGLGSTELIVFGPKEGVTDPAYVYHLARSEIIRGPAISQMVGTTGRARVPNNVFNEIYVALPPLPEQRRIAEILSSVDDAIAATRAVIEQTRKVKQAVLERLLTKGMGHTRFKQTKIGEIPEGWEVMSLIDAGVRILDGDRGKEYPKADEYQDSGHCLFLSAKNVTRTGFSFEKSQFISKEKHKKLGNGLLQRLDIVVSTRGTIGNFAFYGQEIEFDCIRINSGMAILRSVDSEISPDFLFALSASELIHDQLRRRVFGSAQPQLTLDILRKLLVPMPTKQEQLSIAEKAIELREVEATQRTKLSALEQFKSALMSDLLTGRKRVTDALPLAAE